MAFKEKIELGEFLKPTKSKIILFIILFLVFPVPVAFQNIGPCPPEMKNPPITCDYGYVWRIELLGGLFFIGALIAHGNQWFPLSMNTAEVLKILYIIILPYLISCLVISLLRKGRQK